MNRNIIAIAFALIAALIAFAPVTANAAAQPVVRSCVQSTSDSNASSCTMATGDKVQTIEVVMNIAAMPAQLKTRNGGIVSAVSQPSWTAYGKFTYTLPNGKSTTYSWE